MTITGVVARPAWQLVLPKSQPKPKRALLTRVAVDQATPGMPHAVWDAVQRFYGVSSSFSPFTTPGSPMVNAQPVMELATVIDQNLAHTPVTVQFSAGIEVPCADQAAATQYTAAGIPSGRKLEEALPGSITCDQGIRLQNQPQLLSFRTTRRSCNRLLLKAHPLVYQLTHAATIGQELVTDGLAGDNLTTIGTPLTAAGIAHMQAQASNGSVFFTVPADVDSTADRLCATMLVSAGAVLEVPAGGPVSVVDTIVWPATPGYFFVTRGVGEVPPFADEVPSANILMAFVKKYVENHSLQEDFHAAAIEAAAIVGGN